MNKDCSGCKKKCKRNDFLKCGYCKQILCIDGCSQVTYNRYDLMTAERRSTWKCRKCIIKSSTPLAASSSKPKPKTKDVKFKGMRFSGLEHSSVNSSHHTQDGNVQKSNSQERLEALNSSLLKTPGPTNIESSDLNEIIQLSVIHNNDHVTTRKKESDTVNNTNILKSGPSCIGCQDLNEETEEVTSDSQTSGNDSLQLSVINNSDNVTCRKRYIVNVPVKNSFDSLSSAETDDEDKYHPVKETSIGFPRSMSCLDLNEITQKNELESLREQVLILKTQLLSAENEIETMLSENCNLKLEVNRYVTKIEQLAKLGLNINSRKKKTKNKGNKNYTLPNLEAENDLTTEKLSVVQPLAGKFISNQAEVIRNSKTDTDHLDVDKENILMNTSMTTKKSKLHIFSNNKNLKILKNIENSDLYNDNDFCNYIYPNNGITQVLKGLKEKLKGFTKDDHCIIMIGEEDFKATQNYAILVRNIRDYLQNVEVCTNIIIAVPTYICGGSMYNSRVETFNSLLLRDTQLHNYAYCFDSNAQLTYEMFSIKTGKLNNQGVKNVLRCLRRLIIKEHAEVDNTKESYTQSNHLNRKNQATQTDYNIKYSSNDINGDNGNGSQFFQEKLTLTDEA